MIQEDFIKVDFWIFVIIVLFILNLFGFDFRWYTWQGIRVWYIGVKVTVRISFNKKGSENSFSPLDPVCLGYFLFLWNTAMNTFRRT